MTDGMAGHDAFLTRLQRLLAAMDDDSLAALANKGLVRRAKKDLETLKPAIVKVESDRVLLNVGEHEVTVPEVPARATSNSPAAGIDRYVLAALIYLRDHLPQQEQVAGLPLEEGRQELAALDDDMLARWAGKGILRKARKAAAVPACQIEENDAIVIRIPARNIVCRWIPGGGLENMVVRGPSQDPREDGLVAVLAYQVAAGIRSIDPEEAALQASAGSFLASRPPTIPASTSAWCESIRRSGGTTAFRLWDAGKLLPPLPGWNPSCLN